MLWQAISAEAPLLRYHRPPTATAEAAADPLEAAPLAAPLAASADEAAAGMLTETPIARHSCQCEKALSTRRDRYESALFAYSRTYFLSKRHTGGSIGRRTFRSKALSRCCDECRG